MFRSSNNFQIFRKKTAPIGSILNFNSNQRNWTSTDQFSLAHSGYVNNVIAYRCIKMIATSVASVPLIVKNRLTDHVYRHPILKLLYRPNHRLSIFDLMEHIVSHYLIFGNSFLLKIYVNEQIKEIHSLAPGNIKFLYNREDNHCGYCYQVSSNNRKEYFIDELSGDCEILHIKNFHPLDNALGLSAVEAARFAIDQHNQASEWNQSLLRNGARPSGAMIVKYGENSTGVLSEEQYERIKGQINELYTGTQNTGKPLLLEGGLEWKEMSINPKDMDFVNMKNSAARDIALAFGVPPQILGIPGDNTYSNLAEARVALWEQTILPILDLTLYNLNNWLLSSYEKEEYYLTYNPETISQLSIKREKLWEIIKDCDFMTKNEKRAFFGLDEIE